MDSKRLFLGICLWLGLSLSGCGEEPPALKLQPGGCGVVLKLTFGPQLPEAPSRWQGHIEAPGLHVELLNQQLESADRVLATPSPSWSLQTADGDTDSLTFALRPEAADLDAYAESELEIRLVDDLQQQTLSYGYAQLKPGYAVVHPIDRAGWTHLFALESRFVAGPCPSDG